MDICMGGGWRERAIEILQEHSKQVFYHIWLALNNPGLTIFLSHNNKNKTDCITLYHIHMKDTAPTAKNKY